MIKSNYIIKILILFVVIIFNYSQSFSKDNIFWEVNNKNATVYLLGSVHFGSEDMYPLDTAIENAFSKSGYLITEIRLDNLTMKDLKFDLFLPKNDSLSAHISDTTYKKLLDYFKSKMSEQYVKKMSPTGVFLTVSQIESMKAGLKPDLGIDMYFTKKADNKIKMELETPESQFRIFDVFKGYENDLVEYSLQSTLDMGDAIDTTVIAWKNGDVKALESLVLNEFDKDTTELGRRFTYEMLDSRNFKMTDKIEKLLDTEGIYFVIVGAAHLVGPKGIVKALEDKKYKVVRR